MVDVNWTIQSINDIENIAEYIAKDSAKYAQVQDFFAAAKILEEFPKAGRIVPEFNKRNIREIIVGFYRIIYQILTPQRIDILTVHHSYRLLEKNIITKGKK